MKHFKPIVFTAIALAAFVFPTGCVNQAKKAPPPRRVVAKPIVDTQRELDFKLLKAAHGRDLETVKVCVKKGGNVNVQDPSGWSAAMWAVWHWFDDKPLCAYIMHSGGAFAQHQKDHLLERAARTGDCARAEFFLGLGANPNYVNAFGENCATLALRYFRGQYGIPENENALPRYGNLEDINLALKLNIGENDAAEKQLAAVRKALDEYKARADSFAKQPQGSPSASEEFEGKEFENAQAFYKSAKDESAVPEDLASASMIYNAMLAEASAAKDAAGKNLQYVKFVELLKAKGANLRKLLAGTQDNSGKQDDWKGQEDKWTMDPVARLAVREAFPHIVDGLWDGELALIQLIGRGEEIFKGQAMRPILPLPKEYFFEFCLNNTEDATALEGGQKAVKDLIRKKYAQARTTHWMSAGVGTGAGFGSVGLNDYDADISAWMLGGHMLAGSVTSYTEATQEEKEQAAARGAQAGQETGRYLGAMKIVMNGEDLLAAINEEVEAWNAMARERNSGLFALYKELPLEGELAEKWNGRWERRMIRLAENKNSVAARIRKVLEEEAERLEKSLKKASGRNVIGNGDAVRRYNESEDEAEARFEQETETLEKIRTFLASDFFKETPLAELIANPPHPRDADPVWYAQNCLGKIKAPEVFTNAAKALLDYGVDVNARANGTNHPALVCAYLWDKPEFETLLLGYGADKKLALFHICERNDFDLLKKLLPRITSLAEVPEDGAGNSILHRAVLSGRADMIPEIVKRGVPVNARNKHDDTALHLAAELENEACVVALINAGANVNAKDKDGRKPFQRFWNVPSPELTKIFSDAHKASK